MDQPAPMPEAQGSEQPAQAGGVEQIIQSVGEGLSKLQHLFSKAQGMEQEKELSAKLYQGFGMLVQMLSSDGGGQQPADSSVSPVETGGRPSSPAL